VAKKIKAIAKLVIPAGKATPAPPIGPSLAQYGINLGDFVKQFNDASRSMMGFKVGVEITIYEDRSFNFVIKQPPASELIKKPPALKKARVCPIKIK